LGGKKAVWKGHSWENRKPGGGKGGETRGKGTVRNGVKGHVLEGKRRGAPSSAGTNSVGQKEGGRRPQGGKKDGPVSGVSLQGTGRYTYPSERA